MGKPDPQDSPLDSKLDAFVEKLEENFEAVMMQVLDEANPNPESFSMQRNVGLATAGICLASVLAILSIDAPSTALYTALYCFVIAMPIQVQTAFISEMFMEFIRDRNEIKAIEKLHIATEQSKSGYGFHSQFAGSALVGLGMTALTAHFSYFLMIVFLSAVAASTVGIFVAMHSLGKTAEQLGQR